MPQEIERKFLVTSAAYRDGAKGTLIRQGYLPGSAGSDPTTPIVRVRIAGAHAYLTVKGPNTGISRAEFEYEIPVGDAEQMLDAFCRPLLVEKIRYEVVHDGFVWEVDEFLGANKGLVVAEIELAHEQQAFDRPPWLGPEVSHDPRYFNNRLLTHPYKEWEP